MGELLLRAEEDVIYNLTGCWVSVLKEGLDVRNKLTIKNGFANQSVFWRFLRGLWFSVC